MLNFIHGADFHLDSPFAGLGPAQAAQRREEQRELLDRLADLARETGAQLVLLSGDLVDSHRVYQETARALCRCLGSIPCPVFLAPGNHDYYSPSSVYAGLDWPENVHIFSSGEMERVELKELGCAVYGRAFLAPREEGSPLAGFRAEEDNLFRLGCLHGDTAPNSPYGPITREELAGSGLHYLALGHIHQGTGLQRAGEAWWAYPGCPEGRGFDETGEKGVLHLTGEPGALTARFVPLARRRYGELEVDLTGRPDPLSALRAALPGGTQEDIYRITLTGEGDAPDLRALEEALAPSFFALTLRDRTRLPRDLWARRGEDTLTGLFLEEMSRLCQGEPDNERYQLAARFGLAALEGGEDVSR